MQNITRLIALTTFTTCTFALCACAGHTDRIEGRQSARTSGLETRQDRYDARYKGRQERREIRSERADTRYNSSW
jgi:hypothetical protein